MPKITSPMGIAINNRGFIRLSLTQALAAFGYWKRRGSGPEDAFRCETGAEVHATVEF